MAQKGSQRKSIIPKLTVPHFRRFNEWKSASSLRDISKQHSSTQETERSRLDALAQFSFTQEENSGDDEEEEDDDDDDDDDDADRSSSEASDTGSVIRHPLPFDETTDPILLGEDFSALLQIPSISVQEELWIDLWQEFKTGEKITPVDGQYLSSLKSFVGLRFLKVTGMLKSYQKQLFQAIWKMEQLEDLHLRMAEEPSLTSQVSWRRIGKDWLPGMHEPYTHISPSDGKGRIKRQYGKAEYLDNCVIELAKPRLAPEHPDFESWMTRLLPIVNLTLYGFVVDAIPFCSCFDPQRLRSITFIDCYDAGFYLPHDMMEANSVEIRVDESEKATVALIRQVSPDFELKRITLKGGKKIEEYPASYVPSSSSSSRSRSRYYSASTSASASSAKYDTTTDPRTRGGRPGVPTSSIPRSSKMLFSHGGVGGGGGGKIPRLPWHFQRNVLNSVIREDEAED